MKKASESNEKTKIETKEQKYTIAFLVEDADVAAEYQDMLVSNDIPVVVQAQDEDGDTFAVMVPEEYLEESQVVIDSQASFDDFYDFTLDENGDFDDNVFDDDY